MVTLLCFCCDHRNPAGSKFCNACGTPLHLKPCKHCEAINARAAAHCHQCGETFALEYLSLDDAAELGHPAAAAPALAGTEAPGDAPRPFLRPQHGILRARIVALLCGLTATAMLSAYYAYRHPHDADAAERPSAAGAPAAPDAPPGNRPGDGQAPATQGSSALPVERPRTAVGGVAATIPDDTNRATPLETTNAGATSKRPQRDARKADPAAKSGSVPRRLAIGPGQDATSASAPVAADRPGEPEPQAVRGPIALQQTVAVPPSTRSASAHPAPAAPSQRSRDAARRPVPAMGSWDRPCAEGVALDPACDVRMMAKGN